MPNAKALPLIGSIIEVLAVLGLLLHASLLLATWNLLPESIPVHFNFAGQPDAWGAKTELLLLLALSSLIYLGLSWLARHPQKLNYPWQITERNRARQYALAVCLLRVLKLQSVCLFAFISLQMIGVSLGFSNGLGYLFTPVAVLVTLATVMGYFVLASRS